MPPRYDITQSYEWNYVHAPEAVPEVEVPPYPGEWDFLGIPVNSPLGIPAGPLLNSKWIHYYAKLGFDVLVYKTVRSGARASYDPPNLLPVAVADLAREGTEIEADPGAANPRTWAISFGMPSRAPEEWRPDVERARKGMGKGQALVVSVVASPRPGWTLDDLARDFARCGVWAAEAGAQVVEANLSCPNVCTQEADLYLDAKAAGVIAAELRARVPRLPLVLKIGLFPREEQAGALVEAVSPFVDGLSSANSITAVVRGEFGGLRRGIGGAAISRRCAEEIGMLKGIVARHGSGLRLIGVGGVMTGADVERRLAGGAHAVQMATAPMLDPEIALKIRRQKSNGNFAFLCTGLHTYKMIPVDTPVAEAQPETTATTQSFAEQVIAREKQYVLQNYGRYPLVLARGRGAWVYDPDGNRYLDLLSGIGVNALGHAHPRLLRVLREQAGLMIHISNLYYHEYQGRLAERLAKVSGLQRTFFCNSGAEAMEGAIKMVRAHGQSVDADKYEIVALENSFHGRTIGALSITGQPKYRKPFGPLMPGVKFVPVNDVAALEAAVSERTAGIVMEPVQGEGGVYPVPEAMLRKARELADRHDALLVFDEIQCGVGRMGTWFAYQGLDPVAMPDVLTSAKPIGCGIPIGFVICNERAAKTIPAGMHGTTFGGGPLATRVALEFMDVLEELLPQVRERGEYFRHKLELLKARYSFIKDVRVRGLMIGVELDRPGKELVTECMKEGLLINCTHEVVLRFLPPFIISESEIDKACRILSRVFKRWGA